MKHHVSPLAAALIREITDQPQQFYDLIDRHREVPWPEFLRTWGELRRAEILSRDEDDGHYLIGGPPTAA
jgi:hypothetical protein